MDGVSVDGVVEVESTIANGIFSLFLATELLPRYCGFVILTVDPAISGFFVR